MTRTLDSIGWACIGLVVAFKIAVLGSFAFEQITGRPPQFISPATAESRVAETACEWGDLSALRDVGVEICGRLAMTRESVEMVSLFAGDETFRRCNREGLARLRASMPVTKEERALFCIHALRQERPNVGGKVFD